VKAAFKRIMESKKSGFMPRLLPETRFAYIDIMCKMVLGGKEETNIAIYQAMLNKLTWLTNTAVTVPTQS